MGLEMQSDLPKSCSRDHQNIMKTILGD